MKLRSIVLAGLLGSTLLMTSGCGKDDVIDAINDALKINIIHVANASSETSFYVDGTVEQVPEDDSKMFVVDGKDSYTVSNGDNDSPENFAKDSAHLYALCEDGNVLRDSASGERKIKILNLSSDPMTAGDGEFLVILYDEDDEVLAEMALAENTLAACTKKTLLEPSKDFDLSDVRKVDVSGLSYDVPDYHTDVADALNELNDVDFDIVIFDHQTVEEDKRGTIIPLATATALGKI